MKPILCFCLCLLSVTGFCQVKVGVQAGYNSTTFLGDDIQPVADYYYHASSLSAFNVGIMSSIPLIKRLYLQPSLLLSEKGAKEESGGWGPYYHTHLHLYYAHLPVQFMYTFINKKQLQVSAGAGGFISKAIWGKAKWSSESYDSTGLLYSTHGSYKINFTDDFNGRSARPWDYGYTVAAAANWQNWQLKASYDFGVVNVAVADHKSGVFSLSAGYYFTKKKKEAHKDGNKPNL